MRLFLSYLIVVALSFPCCGQKEKKATATPTVSTEKTVVNDTTLLVPEKPIGWTSDFEILTAEQVIYLDSIIQAHKNQTGNEVAVVTLILDPTKVRTAEEFDNLALTLFNKWAIGEKEKNNGVGIMISTSLRNISIQVGLGLPAKLTNEEAKSIMNNIILPEFKKGDYFRGILNGLNAVFEEIK